VPHVSLDAIALEVNRVGEELAADHLRLGVRLRRVRQIPNQLAAAPGIVGDCAFCRPHPLGHGEVGGTETEAAFDDLAVHPIQAVLRANHLFRERGTPKLVRADLVAGCRDHYPRNIRLLDLSLLVLDLSLFQQIRILDHLVLRAEDVAAVGIAERWHLYNFINIDVVVEDAGVKRGRPRSKDIPLT
jgi:hypothetical protein